MTGFQTHVDKLDHDSLISGRLEDPTTSDIHRVRIGEIGRADFLGLIGDIDCQMRSTDWIDIGHGGLESGPVCRRIGKEFDPHEV